MSRCKLPPSERYLPATSSPLLNKSGAFRHNLVTAPDMMPCTGQLCCVEKGLWRDVARALLAKKSIYKPHRCISRRVGSVRKKSRLIVRNLRYSVDRSDPRWSDVLEYIFLRRPACRGPDSLHKFKSSHGPDKILSRSGFGPRAGLWACLM